jgi:hypothetical protein
MLYLKHRVNVRPKVKDEEKEVKMREVYEKFAGEFLKKTSSKGALINYHIHHWFL